MIIIWILSVLLLFYFFTHEDEIILQQYNNLRKSRFIVCISNKIANSKVGEKFRRESPEYINFNKRDKIEEYIDVITIIKTGLMSVYLIYGSIILLDCGINIEKATIIMIIILNIGQVAGDYYISRRKIRINSWETKRRFRRSLIVHFILLLFTIIIVLV